MNNFWQLKDESDPTEMLRRALQVTLAQPINLRYS